MAPCSIRWCGKESKTSKYNTDGITFHRYPRDGDLKEKWINATRRENWFPSKYSVICSRHFTQDCFLQMKNRRRLLSSAVPSLLLPLLGDSEHTESNLATSGLKTAVPKSSSSPAIEHDKRKQSSDSPSTSFVTQFRTKRNSETPKSKNEQIVGESPSKYDTPIKKRLSSRIIIELSDKIVKKNRQLKNLRQKTSYLIKRISTLKTIVEDLQKKNTYQCKRRHSL